MTEKLVNILIFIKLKFSPSFNCVESSSWSLPGPIDLLLPVTVSQLPPPHTQLSHYSHPHTVLSQPPPPHTLHKKSSQPLSQIQQKKKKMAYASKYRFQEESVLPLHNTTVHSKYNEPSPAETVAEKETVTELFVLCIPLHKLSRPVQFVTCVLGVMFFYLLYGYTQVS